jgi:hypothetical protein
MGVGTADSALEAASSLIRPSISVTSGAAARLQAPSNSIATRSKITNQAKDLWVMGHSFLQALELLYLITNICNKVFPYSVPVYSKIEICIESLITDKKQECVKVEGKGFWNAAKLHRNSRKPFSGTEVKVAFFHLREYAIDVLTKGIQSSTTHQNGQMTTKASDSNTKPPLLTGAKQTMLTWAKVLESYETVPEAYREFLQDTP